MDGHISQETKKKKERDCTRKWYLAEDGILGELVVLVEEEESGNGGSGGSGEEGRNPHSEHQPHFRVFTIEEKASFIQDLRLFGK